MVGKDFLAHIANVTTKGHGDDNEVQITLTMEHGSLEATMVAAFLLEAKRAGGAVNVSIETQPNAQMSLWDDAAGAIESELADIEGVTSIEVKTNDREPQDLPVEEPVGAAT